MHDTTEEKVLEVSEEQLTRAERSEQKITKPEPTPYFLTLLCSLDFSCTRPWCSYSLNRIYREASYCSFTC